MASPLAEYEILCLFIKNAFILPDSNFESKSHDQHLRKTTISSFFTAIILCQEAKANDDRTPSLSSSQLITPPYPSSAFPPSTGTPPSPTQPTMQPRSSPQSAVHKYPSTPVPHLVSHARPFMQMQSMGSPASTGPLSFPSQLFPMSTSQPSKPWLLLSSQLQRILHG
jgi:hypothetical protein